MTSEYTKPTVIECLIPRKWREKNGVELPDEYLNLITRLNAIIYGSLALFAYILGLFIGSM